MSGNSMELNQCNNLKAVDAWNSRSFDLLLALLNEDAEFPEDFDISVVDNSAEDRQRLNAFVEGRNEVHKCIAEGNIKQLELLTLNSTSKLYLNCKNESAVFTAITLKKFQIYAFLKSKGAEFKNEDEKTILDNLNEGEKFKVQDHLVYYFPRSRNSHVHYLVSKSRSSKPVSDFDERVKTLYETLDKIPEVSKILQVIQHSEYLDIVFDFDKENILDVCPNATKTTRGETRNHERRLYIAAGQDEEKLLGTLAHELTHMAMEIIYENECNPYRKHGKEQEKKFQEITIWVKEHISNVSGDISKVIMDGFNCYRPEYHHSELIARVPHALAQFKKRGREFFTKVTENLLRYFNDVMVDCEKFIDHSCLLKPKNQIRLINESSGEVKNIQKCSIYFKDVSRIQKFLKEETANVLIIKGENTWLSLLRTLQSLYGQDYMNTYSQYLALKFDAFAREALPILRTFIYEVSDTLIIIYPQDSELRSNLNLQHEGVKWISKLLKMKSNKRIIFVIHTEMELEVARLFEYFNMTFASMTDECPTLMNLDDESQNLILNKMIWFQGRDTPLKNFVKNIKVKHLIDGETITKLVGGDRIPVGRGIVGLAHLDSAYADLQEEINVNRLADGILKGKNSIFIFQGLRKVEDLLCIIENRYAGSLNSNSLHQKLLNSLEKRTIIIANAEFADEEFKNVCRHNCQRYIFWIRVTSGNDKSLMLRKVYNPTFYVERRVLMYEKIAIRITGLEELSKAQNTRCLISNTNAQELSVLFQNALREEEEKMENDGSAIKLYLKGKNIEVSSRYLNLDRTPLQNIKVNREASKSFIIFETDEDKSNSKEKSIIDTNAFVFVETDQKANEIFQELVKLGGNVYWLKKEGSNIFYNDSRGSLENLRSHIDGKKCVKRQIYDSCLTDHIKNFKIVLFADDPGMGKTTTLANLCHDEYLTGTSWIVEVNLKLLLKYEIKTDIQSLITILSKTDTSLGTSLARTLLRSAMDKEYDFPRPLLFVFDGFNEILDENDRKKIISLLKFLKEETKVKFWITTRPHCRELLEDNLSVFPLQLQPMDDEEKRELIAKYIKIRLVLSLLPENDRFLSYVEIFLKRVKEIFQFPRFVGSPLQLHLMLEGAVEYFKVWAENRYPENIDFSYLGKNILEVYGNFINKKYENFKQVKNEGNEYSLEEIRSICDLCHIKLAETLTMDSDPRVSAKNFEGVNNALACGIVKCVNGSLKFIHPTFQEYYAAKLFFNWITQAERFSNYEKLKYIFKKILLEADYQYIRLFLEYRLKNINIEDLPTENIKNAYKIVQKLTDRKGTKDETFIDVTIQEEHANIFDFSISLLLRGKMTNLFNITCRFGDSVLTYACRCNKMRIVERILNKCKETFQDEPQFLEFLSLRGRSKETCLHHAAFYCNTGILQLILDAARAVCSSEEQFHEFLKTKDDYGNTILHLAATSLGQYFSDAIKNYEIKYFEEYLQIVFVLLYRLRYKYAFPELPYEMLYKNFWKIMHDPTYNPEDYSLFNALGQFKNVYQDRLSLTAYNAVKLIVENLEGQAFYMLNSRNMKGFSAIHLAVGYGDIASAEFMLDKVETLQNSWELPNYGDYSSMYKAIASDHCDIFKLMLEKVPSERMYNTLIMSYITGVNFLHIPAYLGKSNLVEFVLSKLKTTCPENLKAFLTSKANEDYNPLHMAAQEGHANVVEILLRYAAEGSFDLEYLISLNFKNRNPIQFAAAYNRTDVFRVMLSKIQEEKREEILLKADDEGFNVLILAATGGSEDIVKLVWDMLKDTPDNLKTFWYCHTHDGCNPLLWAADTGRLNIVQMLLELAGEISFDFQYEYLTSTDLTMRTAFYFALEKNHTDIFTYMFEKIPKEKIYDVLCFPDYQSCNILHHAAYHGNGDSIKLIVTKIKEILGENFEDYLFLKAKGDMTALHVAAQQGHLHVVEILLQFAAEKSLQYHSLAFVNQRRQTAMEISIRLKHRDVAAFLLGQIPEDKTYELFSFPGSLDLNVLHLSAAYGEVELVKKILSKMKEISIESLETLLLSKADKSFNSLHLAVQEGQRDVLEILLRYASDRSPDFYYNFLTSTNDGKENAIFISIFHNSGEIAKILLNEIPAGKMWTTITSLNDENLNILHKSAFSGNTELVELMLDLLKQKLPRENFEAFLYSPAIFGKNALHLVAEEGHFDLVKLLLKYASEFQYEYLTSVDCRKRNALHIAVIAHHCEIANWLLNQIPVERLNEVLSHLDVQNGNILHYTAYFGQNDLIKMMLNAIKTSKEFVKQFLQSRFTHNFNALHLATQRNHPDVVETLLQCAGEISVRFQYQYLITENENGNALHLAASQNRCDPLISLLRNIPEDFYETSSTPDSDSQLKSSSSIRNLEAFLFSQSNGFNALHMATGQGHINIVKILLEYTGKISSCLQYKYLMSRNKYNRFAIHIAISENHSDVAAYMIKKLPPEKKREVLSFHHGLGWNMLHLSSYLGNSDILTLILHEMKELSSKEDFERFLFSKDDEGENALHRAASEGHCGIVEILLYFPEQTSLDLQYKYLTSVSEGEKRNPILLAVLQKRDVAVWMLDKIPEEKMLDVLFFCDFEGCIILHYAAYKGMTNILVMILSKSKQVSPSKIFQAFLHPGKRGYNALQVAAHGGHLDFIKILLQYVMDKLPPNCLYQYLTSVNDKMRNAIYMAIKKNHTNAAAWMLGKIPLDKIFEFVGFADHQGFNILQRSAFKGSTDMVRLIFSKLELSTSSTNIFELLSLKTREGHSAYILALQQGHLQLSEIILYFKNLHASK